MNNIINISGLMLISVLSFSQASQPESSSFSSGSSEMVDLKTGAFNYDIPLLEVGGYPINLSYQSGINMNQQASMVGLGWNINIGAITRDMRGLPDDFNGDIIETKTNFKENITVGLNLGSDLEIFGFKPTISPKFDPTPLLTSKKNSKYNKEATLGLKLGVYYNSYTGYGFEWVFSPSISAKDGKNKNINKRYELGVNFSKKSDDLTTNLKPVIRSYNKSTLISQLNIGTSINSISGLKSLSYNFGLREKFTNSNGWMFNNHSYTPSLDYLFNTSSFTYNAKLGPENWGLFTNIKTSVYYTKSKLKDTISNVEAYGYLYMQNATDHDVIDVNREKDVGYSKESPNLHVPALMSDIFSVSGHGVGGTFRPFRNDVGVLFEPKKSQNYGSGSLGTDFGAGFGVGWKVGVKPSFVIYNEKSNKWKNNIVTNNFDFKSNQINSLFESAYFKNIGEKTIMSYELFDNIGKYNAVKLDLEKLNSNATMSWVDNKNTVKHSPFNIIKNNNRAKRTQVFSFLTSEEASLNNSTSSIEYVTEDYFISNLNKLSEPRINDNRKAHHISHCEVINSDGMRYNYSIPIYNNVNEETSFSVCNDELSNGLVEYTSVEDSIANVSGLRNFYEKRKIPPYAYAYLLTSVLSYDYVDVLDDGISDDDIGNYVKFNYFKATDDYKWRFPYGSNGVKYANFNEGFESKRNDNRGNYLYGEKELVYIQSIESKTEVAIFKYEDRIDSYESKGREGGMGTQSMKKLKEISLYNKRDLLENGSAAVPLKTVYFNYDYSLLQNIPGSNHDIDGQFGRLTLKDLYFTYNDNPKSKKNKYNFDYINDFPFNRNDIDRWGVYKPSSSNPNNLNNTHFPYVVQSNQLNDQIKKDKDLYSSQWNLNNISTPSGSEIKILYESDDYAFVQDKQAMSMTPLIGINTVNNKLLYEQNKNTFTPNSTLLFKVPKGAKSADEFLQDSLLYLRAYVNIFKGYYEYVPCYLEVEEMILDKQFKEYDILKLKLKNSTTKDKKGKPINPISKYAIQFAKLHMNDLLTTNLDAKSCNNVIDEKSEDELIKWSKDNIALIGNYYQQRLKDNHAMIIDLDKSYARLNNILFSKLGGGNRVKSIEIYDKWKELTDGTENSTFYATDYFYTTNHNGKLISSGVASYEPLIGGDENPFRKPLFYSKKNVLAPDDRLMVEYPIGEIHYPSPRVVYAEVTQKVRRNSLDKKYATGKTINCFYTSRDFPTNFDQTELDVRKTSKVSTAAQFTASLNPAYKYSIENVKVSQGYSVINNDMHGKPKSTFIYGEGQKAAISGIEYFYKTNKQNKLDNNFDVINSDGSIGKELIGVDYEFFIDMRERETNLKGIETSFDVDAATPIITSTAIPTLTNEKTSFKSAVFQKVIYQYGLLDSIRVFDKNSEIVTKNLALDAENTDVLLSKKHNEYGDPIYNTAIPAHWVYKNMSGSYKNISASYLLSTDVDGKISPLNSFNTGDEILMLDNTQNFNKAWIYEYNGNQYLLDVYGNIIKSLPKSLGKIIRSSYRNTQRNNIAKYKTIDPPNIKDFSNNIILDASAIEYSDIWRVERKNSFTDSMSCYPVLNKNLYVNPYQLGIRGIWRPKKSYLYLTNRDSKNSIRNSGYFEYFSPFWQFKSGKLVKSNSSNWQSTSELTEVHPSGLNISIKDPLGRYSSSILGHDNKLIIASVSNSKINNAINLNFEDLNLACNESDLYRHLANYTTDLIAHTGNTSLMLNQNSKSIIQSLNVLTNTNSGIPYKLQDKDVISDFKPDTGTYIVSVWVKEEHKNYTHKYLNAQLKIKLDNQQFIFKADGPMVEGWQKIEGQFTIDPTHQQIEIIFDKNLFQNKIYFDDFRIHSAQANMVSHVYDKRTHRLMASLDENNYAVFYEYDDEGMLIRKKRETEIGVITIDEKRNHITSE